MNCIVKKTKWFIVAMLVVLVVGMTLFGIFGFNNAVDYRDGYELQVSVNQNIDQAKDVMKDTADKYLSDNGLKTASYAIQELDDGATVIYKLYGDVTNHADTLESALNTALQANEKTKSVQAEVMVNTILGDSEMQFGWVILAVGISVVAIFLYMLIMERLASALAVIGASIASLVLFVAIMGITRIPALPYVEVLTAFSAIFGAVLSVTTTRRYKEEIKSVVGKYSASAIACNVINKDFKKYLFALIAVFVAAVAISALLVPYMMFAGLQILVAGIAAVCSAYVVTPIIWTAVMSIKNK